ncbi:GNAT family N-acetyltransferase [Streptococcus gallolyticus]|uniref:GNAT family N-acetyltransferase n=1 Tax=Streptococcus hepaticus TaxID=3349163 RepID=UPI001C949FE7|nr:GNAT family N-acetyltransferase [Streptococcus gallolyticus]MBY5041535.1 GNAT family N-acetyltransferase [Streptococcus gallolyticus]
MEIRSARVEDAAQLLKIYEPYIRETAITFETEVPSVAEFEQRILETQKKHPYLVVEEEGQILGYAYAHPYYGRAAYAWTVELSIYIDQEARAQGLGTALYDLLEEKLAAQGVLNFLVCISLPNDASIAFHHKRGYEQVAHFKNVGYKLGSWRDIVWLQKSLGQSAQPSPLLYKWD